MACTGVPEHFHSIFFKDAGAMELHSAVKCGLTAECKQDTIRLLLADDTFNEIGCHRKEIDLVGKTVGCLDGRDIGVDEDGGNPSSFMALSACEPE